MHLRVQLQDMMTRQDGDGFLADGETDSMEFIKESIQKV